MIRNFLRKNLRKNDEAISPVIGTILMIAATVIVGGAVYAAVSAYSGKTAKPTVDAGFKAQALDTDNDGLEDRIKITYLSGPRDLAAGSVALSLRDSAGVALVSGVSSHSSVGYWNAGDYETYRLPTTGGTAGTIFVSIAVQDNTVLDQTLTLRET